jgi:hypothetical protein
MDPLATYCDFSPRLAPVTETRITTPRLIAQIDRAKTPEEALKACLDKLSQDGHLSDIPEATYQKLREWGVRR